jgi:hypothetical protein
MSIVFLVVTILLALVLVRLLLPYYMYTNLIASLSSCGPPA